ncbi:MAG: glycosyltransferase [Candidatus Methanoperedenaceae archaeon]|nr:glycosyltransferase [Candidatus Methanoperedenaceae archaeon]
MKYSICTTNYNTEDVIEDCLNSIISQIDENNYEIIIVDNKSSDKSPQIIERYLNKYKNIKLISMRCSRGKGRQIAFEKSKGDYIIQIDCDTIYRSEFKKFIETYEKNEFDFCIHAHYCGIYPKELLSRVGGWKDLNYAEDVDLWMRLLKINSFKWSRLIIGNNIKKRVHQNIFEKYYRKFCVIRDVMFIPCYNLKYIQKMIYKNNKSYKLIFWTIFLYITYVSFVLKSIKLKTKDLEFNMEMYLNNIIDLEIEGETKEWWKNIPEAMPLD